MLHVPSFHELSSTLGWALGDTDFFVSFLLLQVTTVELIGSPSSTLVVSVLWSVVGSLYGT